MKLELKPHNPEGKFYEPFMNKERHDKMHKLLFMSIFRQLVYKGRLRDVLEEVVEQCQTAEEMVYCSLVLFEQQKAIGQMIAKDFAFGMRITFLAITPKDAMVEEKEEFLAEVGETYNEAWADAQDFINNRGDVG